MYVPILKARQIEMRILKNLNFCFSKEIIPLVEIISEKDDLKTIISNVEENIIFVDYLRISIEKYGDKFDPTKVVFSMEISRSEESYINYLKELLIYDNAIPTISIKNNFDIDELALEELYNDLSIDNRSVALRITPLFIEKHKHFLEHVMKEKDYLLYDIGETNFFSREMELEELSDMNILACKIILNSPRESRLTNGEFEETGKSILIDNCVAKEYINQKFIGFGDYCGYKDILPRKNGSKGAGAAIALIYNFKENVFLSFVEKNTKLGVRGYNKVIEDILNQKDKIEDFDNCIAMKRVEEISMCDKKGNWATWIGITITRYIYQIYLNS